MARYMKTVCNLMACARQHTRHHPRTGVIALSFTLSMLLGTLPALAKEPLACPNAPAAFHGAVHDQYLLGQAFEDGTCDHPIDRKQAQHWYELAANGGDMISAYALGELYFTTTDAEPDYVSARRWYLKAAEAGYGPAQLRLGFLYAEKHFKGLTADYAEAEKWFKKAAAQNTGDAAFRLGNFYLNYKQPADEKQARVWLLKAAHGGNRTAMFDAGRMLMSGQGGDVATSEGLGLINRSAELGTLQAQMTLVDVYAGGKGTKADPQLALKWILQLANNPAAPIFYTTRAADIFFDGWQGVPRNYPAAHTYYEHAAEKHDRHAIERLGIMYRDGLGVSVDAAKADSYFAQLK